MSVISLNKHVELDELTRNWRRYNFSSIGKYISSSQLPCIAFSERYTDEEIESIINKQLEFYKSLYEDDTVKIVVEKVDSNYHPCCCVILM